MDVGKILGGMLSQRAGRSPATGTVLGQVLKGVAAGMAQQQVPDPRFAAQNQGAIESIVRDAIIRHHQAGGQVPTPATQWITQYGPSYGQQYGTQYPAPYPQPTAVPAPIPQQHNHCSGLNGNQRAEILLQAMIMASQADGCIDAAEQNNIIQQLQPLTQQEVDYLRREFSRTHNVHAFAQSVPPGMEYEVYQISLMSMNVDTPLEAQYLRNLAQCLNIAPDACNAVHQQMNASPIF